MLNAGFDQGAPSSLLLSPVNSRIKWLLRDVHVHFDRAGSHKVCAADFADLGARHFCCKFSRKSSFARRPCASRLRRLAQVGRRCFGSSEGLVLLPRRARFLSYVQVVCQVWGIRGISDIFSSAWQAWDSLHVTKSSAGVGQNERCFWSSFFVARAVFGECGRCF